jgi:formylglycine-generating enzyme required for sulfatase activity
MVMVYVPKGVFTMGSAAGDEDETPVHGVILDAFWIDRTEVTYGMYAQFAPGSGNKGPARFPVVHVSWEQAAAYCKWARSRLPTEAEWEKAARGAQELTYPWGNQPPAADLVNYADFSSHAQVPWANTTVDDGNPGVAPAGKYPAGASPYGALDVAGNVAEWVNDWYDPAYYAQFAMTNPPGPEAGDFRVLRGGSWYSTAAGVRAADRAWYIPEGGTNYAGFRCAKSTVAP